MSESDRTVRPTQLILFPNSHPKQFFGSSCVSECDRNVTTSRDLKLIS